MIRRRQALALGVAGLHASMARAERWPARAVTVIVAGAPASPPDVAIRVIQDELSKRLGQAVIVDDRSGALGIPALEAVTRATRDGYTFGVMTLQAAAAVSLRSKLPFDLMRDLVPVVQLTLEGPVLVVRSDLPVESLDAFVNYVKSRPGKVTFGSSGVGSPSHLGMELLLQSGGVDAVHVPYQGPAAVLRDVVGGRVDAALVGSAAVLPLLGSGRLRALAISSKRRMDKLPKVPTFAEAGYGQVQVSGWTGIVAPVGVAPAIMGRLAADVNFALGRTDVIERMRSVGSEPVGGTGAEFGAFIASEVARWRSVIQRAKITVE